MTLAEAVANLVDTMRVHKTRAEIQAAQWIYDDEEKAA